MIYESNYNFSEPSGENRIYVILDTMLQMLHNRGEVNIGAYVKHTYSHGVSLLESKKELMFIYKVLEEAIKYGDTRLDAESVKDLLQGRGQAKETNYLKFPSSIHLQYKVRLKHIE